MADYMVYVGTHAIDDPTRAGLAFAAARGAIAKGWQAKVALLGDAVLLLNPKVAENTYLAGPGRGSVLQLLSELKGKGAEFELHV